MLAWIFSGDCEGLSAQNRINLLQKLFPQPEDIGFSEHIINVFTEYDGIDILIETSERIIVVENKIKSSQHSNQLERYKALCELNFPDRTPYFYFLTLISEIPHDTSWHIRSFSDLLHAFSDLDLNN